MPKVLKSNSFLSFAKVPRSWFSASFSVLFPMDSSLFLYNTFQHQGPEGCIVQVIDMRIRLSPRNIITNILQFESIFEFILHMKDRGQYGHQRMEGRASLYSSCTPSNKTRRRLWIDWQSLLESFPSFFGTNRFFDGIQSCIHHSIWSWNRRAFILLQYQTQCHHRSWISRKHTRTRLDNNRKLNTRFISISAFLSFGFSKWWSEVNLIRTIENKKKKWRTNTCEILFHRFERQNRCFLGFDHPLQSVLHIYSIILHLYFQRIILKFCICHFCCRLPNLQGMNNVMNVNHTSK